MLKTILLCGRNRSPFDERMNKNGIVSCFFMTRRSELFPYRKTTAGRRTCRRAVSVPLMTAVDRMFVTMTSDMTYRVTSLRRRLRLLQLADNGADEATGCCCYVCGRLLTTGHTHCRGTSRR